MYVAIDSPERLNIMNVITSNIYSKYCSNHAHYEVSSVQHYVIKFVSDLRQIGGFLWALRFPPSIKLTATI